MSEIVSEREFRLMLVGILAGKFLECRSVTGPGRSGAVASVYASHLLGIPWIPYGTNPPDQLKPVLVIDTASRTGRTLRKAARVVGDCETLAVYQEPPRKRFWYEREAQGKV